MIDVASRLLGEGLVQFLLVVLEIEVADFGRHAPFGDHGRGHAGDFVEVVARAARHGVEMELLGYATGERHGHAVHQLVDVHEVGVAGWEVLGVAESALAAGYDGDFEEWVGIFEVPATDGVAGFVVGNGFLLFRAEDEGFLFETADGAFDGLFEVDHGDVVGTCSCGCGSLADRLSRTESKDVPIRAASLQQLAMSAPEKPGVSAASLPVRCSMSSFVTILRRWTKKICFRPSIVGRSIAICLSNRPGRIKAESRTSGLLVPASTTT